MAEETPWYTPNSSNESSFRGRNLMETRESERRTAQSYGEEQSERRFVDPQTQSSTLFTPGLDSHLVGQIAEKGGAMLSEQMGKYTTSYFDFLKPYFDVDQKYVFRKVFRLIYPFGRWSERKKKGPHHNHFGPPSDFLASQNQAKDRMHLPDLYIPTMSFVTYCLLAIASNHSQTKEEKNDIGEVFTSQIFWLLLTVLSESLVLKGGLYFLNSPSNVTFMKIVSTSAYKYVGLALTLLFSWFFHSISSYGNTGYLIVSLYFSVCMSVFIVRSVKEVFVDQKQRVRFDKGRSLRTQFLIIFSLVQVPVMLFLSYKYRSLGGGWEDVTVTMSVPTVTPTLTEVPDIPDVPATETLVET